MSDSQPKAEESGSSPSKSPWIPLESDPDIMSDYLRMLTLTDHYLIDVPVIDGAEEMGIFAGHNVKAFVFLYEINERTVSETEEAKATPALPETNELFFMKQLIQNSCGSVALFHAYLNTVDANRFEPSSLMAKFYQDTVKGNPELRGTVFANNTSIQDLHHTTAKAGQSEVPSGQQLNNINYHFVAIIWRNGRIIKMDGRCDNPVVLANCPEQDFKKEALEAIRVMMQRDPDNLNFSILAFCEN